MYSISTMLYNAESGEVIETRNLVNLRVGPMFIHEFTPRTLEEIGTPVNLKITDMTQYTPGMDRLCLFVRVNGSDRPQEIAFKNNWNIPILDLQERTAIIRCPFYKSLLLEFNANCMKERRL